MAKKLKIWLDGFHGLEAHVCLVEISENPEFEPDFDLRHSPYQSQPYMGRIAESAARKFGCRIDDCRCGEGIDTTFFLDADDLAAGEVTLRGNYPS